MEDLGATASPAPSPIDTARAIEAHDEERLMKVALLPPEALRCVDGLETPQRFYQVLRSPAPLAGMPFPQEPRWKAIADAGFESVVCLTDDAAPYDPSPLRVLHARRFKDLLGGRQPDNPQREA